MRRTHIHFEVVSVAEAKRILEREKLLAERNGKRSREGEDSAKSTSRQHVRTTKSEVLIT
jgi:hypothetical protein